MAPHHAGSVFPLWLTFFVAHEDFWVTFFSQERYVQSSILAWIGASASAGSADAEPGITSGALSWSPPSPPLFAMSPL